MLLRCWQYWCWHLTPPALTKFNVRKYIIQLCSTFSISFLREIWNFQISCWCSNLLSEGIPFSLDNLFPISNFSRNTHKLSSWELISTMTKIYNSMSIYTFNQESSVGLRKTKMHSLSSKDSNPKTMGNKNTTFSTYLHHIDKLKLIFCWVESKKYITMKKWIAQIINYWRCKNISAKLNWKKTNLSFIPLILK